MAVTPLNPRSTSASSVDRFTSARRHGVRRAIATIALTVLLTSTRTDALEQRGVPPDDPWSCPATHPIKGYVSVESGRHVYFLPGTRFYEEASPTRCYASEEEARSDGSRPAGGSEHQAPPTHSPSIDRLMSSPHSDARA
jgi:hypothetical protein